MPSNLKPIFFHNERHTTMRLCVAGVIITLIAWNHSCIAIETLSTGESWQDFCYCCTIALVYTGNTVQCSEGLEHVHSLD